MGDPTTPLLAVQNVSKRFPNGTVALRDVDLTIARGSIHGLVGANGAGKSTLFKIIAGAHEPSAGELIWQGTKVDWSTPAAPRAAGVATMYQHIPLVPTLSVLENVFLGEMSGLFRRGRLLAQYDALCERFGYRPDPNALVGDLPIGERQMVAVAQALAAGATLICMDEPTASMASAEVELLFRAVNRLRESEGTSFVFCSHFLDQVLELTDEVSVLRDGRMVFTGPTSSLDEEKLVDLMVGRKLSAMEDTRMAPVAADAPPVLEAIRLNSPSGVDDVSITVRAGEVIGLAGMLGSGRSEILEAIFGADERCSGTVKIHGRNVGKRVDQRVRAGLALVPEDRNRQGLVSGWEIWRNTTLPDVQKLSKRRMLPDAEAEHARADRAVADLKVRTPSVTTPVSSLSGGNAQKVVFAKWMYGDACAYLLDEPTVGVDVGAKADILELVRGFARAGNAVVIVSSEFEELLAVAQRILVVRGGRIVAERNTQDTDEAELLALSSGLGTNEGRNG
ncbi:sugar ABC transporter ATP-binding protein [Cryptosporangium sp. NPDC048952]|uniref:sugar ABC transporter ATP-binding protein n=1 Tax=Cryptosporangium sp. NPDC048952 TaxID=3363961 RepID=UPI00372239BA